MIGFTGTSLQLQSFTSSHNQSWPPRPLFILLLVLRLTPKSSSKSKLCYDRRSVGQSILKQSTHLRFRTRFLLLPDSCRFVDVGALPWRVNGSVVYKCCWPSPAQSFSGPSPVGLATIFYCLRFENSLFVASYDWQGWGEGIRPRIHTGSDYKRLSFSAINLWHRLRTENTLRTPCPIPLFL
jgi:hypothetical protein